VAKYTDIDDFCKFGEDLAHVARRFERTVSKKVSTDHGKYKAAVKKALFRSKISSGDILTEYKLHDFNADDFLPDDVEQTINDMQEPEFLATLKEELGKANEAGLNSVGWQQVIHYLMKNLGEKQFLELIDLPLSVCEHIALKLNISPWPTVPYSTKADVFAEMTRIHKYFEESRTPGASVGMVMASKIINLPDLHTTIVSHQRRNASTWPQFF